MIFGRGVFIPNLSSGGPWAAAHRSTSMSSRSGQLSWVVSKCSRSKHVKTNQSVVSLSHTLPFTQTLGGSRRGLELLETRKPLAPSPWHTSVATSHKQSIERGPAHRLKLYIYIVLSKNGRWVTLPGIPPWSTEHICKKKQPRSFTDA